MRRRHGSSLAGGRLSKAGGCGGLGTLRHLSSKGSGVGCRSCRGLKSPNRSNISLDFIGKA